MDPVNPTNNNTARREISQIPLISGIRFLWHAARTRFGRAALMGVATLITVLIGVALSLSYGGFCFRQQRFLSEEEYFDAAIDDIIRSPSYQQITSVPGGTRFASLKVIPYKDKKEFWRANPNCCQIVSHQNGPWPTFEERLWGAAAVVVAVAYTVNYVDEIGEPQSTKGTSIYAVTNCGRAWDARY